MKFKEPLKQYLYRWFRQKRSPSGYPPLRGIIISYKDTGTDRLGFIQTFEFSRYNINHWKTHEAGTEKIRDSWLEEYEPSPEEKRHVIESVFNVKEKDFKA